LVAALALVVAGPASAQQEPSIGLFPSRATGEAVRGAAVGPFTLRNGTDRHYDVQVVPILLGQARDGGLFVRDDAAGLASARRLLRPQVNGFDFPPGAARSVRALVRRVSREGSVYGGILFRARQKGLTGGGGQITNVLQLNASLLLRPQAEKRRAQLATEPIRAEQAGPRRLHLLVPIANRGNTDMKVSGSVSILDSAGRPVARRRLRSFEVLPGATVDLPATFTRRLAAGSYTLRSSLRAARRALHSTGALELFGINEVRAQGAKLSELSAPQAYKGKPVVIEATYENTGNVEYAPKAVIEVRPVSRAGRGELMREEAMQVEEVNPGDKGRLTASITLPEDSSSFTLTVRLLDGSRELDARSVSVTPTQQPALLERIGDALTANALPIMAVLAALLAAIATLTIRYVRRLRAAAQRA
jgi:hypothetical protein